MRPKGTVALLPAGGLGANDGVALWAERESSAATGAIAKTPSCNTDATAAEGVAAAGWTVAGGLVVEPAPIVRRLERTALTRAVSLSLVGRPRRARSLRAGLTRGGCDGAFGANDDRSAREPPRVSSSRSLLPLLLASGLRGGVLRALCRGCPCAGARPSASGRCRRGRRAGTSRPACAMVERTVERAVERKPIVVARTALDMRSLVRRLIRWIPLRKRGGRGGRLPCTRCGLLNPAAPMVVESPARPPARPVTPACSSVTGSLSWAAASRSGRRFCATRPAGALPPACSSVTGSLRSAATGGASFARVNHGFALACRARTNMAIRTACCNVARSLAMARSLRRRC